MTTKNLPVSIKHVLHVIYQTVLVPRDSAHAMMFLESHAALMHIVP